MINQNLTLKTAIYALVDPRNPEVVRYIGQTKTPRVRHLKHCSSIETSMKGVWIESLRQFGIFPQIIVLEWVDNNIATSKEDEYIEKYKSENLTNTQIRKNIKLIKDNTKQLINKPIDIEFLNLEGLTKSEEIEIKLIKEKLQETNWNKLATSRILGIGRQTLYNKILKYQITPVC